MNFDQTKYNTELQQRIKKHSVILRHMPDNELQTLWDRMLDNPDKQDAALMIACYREVHRRFVACSWFWRRFLNKKKYQEWNYFIERMEAKSWRFASNMIQKYKYENPEKVKKYKSG